MLPSEEDTIVKCQDVTPLLNSAGFAGGGAGESGTNQRRQTGCEDGVGVGPGSEADGAGSSEAFGYMVIVYESTLQNAQSPCRLSFNRASVRTRPGQQF